MASCYIIWSERLKRFYIGVTTGSPEDRLEKHNKGSYGSAKYTSKAQDWVLFLVIEVETIEHAKRIERKIKAMKSATYTKNLAKYPEMRARLIQETGST